MAGICCWNAFSGGSTGQKSDCFTGEFGGVGVSLIFEIDSPTYQWLSLHIEIIQTGYCKRNGMD